MSIAWWKIQPKRNPQYFNQGLHELKQCKINIPTNPVKKVTDAQDHELRNLEVMTQQKTDIKIKHLSLPSRTWSAHVHVSTKNRYATALNSAYSISGILNKAHKITATKKMGSKLLHANSQKPGQSQIRQMCCVISREAYQTNYPFSQYKAHNYVHFSPCLQQSLSPCRKEAQILVLRKWV